MGDARPVLTEPLSLTALARYFTCRRSLMRLRLERMPGVVRWGNRYRVPLERMPSAYFADHR